jgi:two-component system, NtrC family, response regulator AtoC
MRIHGQIMGLTPCIVELRQEIARIARSDAKVLVTGESGVGKELVAREIHARSLRASHPFIPVNCAGLPETLLESELFGHVKGSFTGAYRDKPGKLESAHDGTIFMDEVGEMSLRMQGLLLRFLETGELQKVGSDRAAGRVNVRVIAATNRPLADMITQGLFREDLFYRLNVIHLVVPPLRERKDDIPAMIDHFLRRFTAANRSAVEEIAPEAIAALVDYGWPGNVRELENVIERMVVVGRGRIAQVSDLPADLRGKVARPAALPTPTAAMMSALPKVIAAVAAPAAPAPSGDIVDDLYLRLTRQRECFWTTVYPLYMQREITRAQVRDLVKKGLEEARGNYKIMVQLFNMDAGDYKKFLNFLRKHQCQLPFKEYRQVNADFREHAASASAN